MTIRIAVTIIIREDRLKHLVYEHTPLGRSSRRFAGVVAPLAGEEGGWSLWSLRGGAGLGGGRVGRGRRGRGRGTWAGDGQNDSEIT